MTDVQLLDDPLLARFESVLRSLGIAVDDLAPGLSDQQIQSIAEPEGLEIPDEVRTWWRWHNGCAPGSTVELFPARAMHSLEQAVTLKTWLPSPEGHQQFGLLPLEGPPHLQLECSTTGSAPAPVWKSLDWAMPVERKLNSFGELVQVWVTDLERGLWVVGAGGEWAHEQPMWEQGFPDDVEGRGIW